MSQNIEQELAQARVQIRGQNAQIEALKDTINELTNNLVTLKTNLFLYRQAHQEVSQNLSLVQDAKNKADEQIETQRAQLGALAQKVIELEASIPKPVEAVVTEDHLVGENVAA